MAELEGGRTRQYPCQLDTVGIDLDAREITLTWSTLIPPPDQPRHLLIGAMPLARMQQMRARPPARSGA